MLTISSGHSADYLVSAVAAGRENYYTGAVAEGEPPGRWYGRGAETLGLEGLVDAQDMTALFEHFVDPRDPAFRDPELWEEAPTLGHRGRRYASEEELYNRALAAEPGAGGERRAELRLEAGRKVRRNVSFLDATFSVQKSVTVLHTAFEAQEVAAQRAGDTEAAEAWAAHRRAVEDAIWAGNRAALDYLAEHAGYSRVGHHGGSAGRYIDAHDWTVASFFQHDSRNHDPQLHVHNAILNRVQGSDGVWRTLDGRSLYAYRGAAAAVGERACEEHLTRSLGVQFATRPDGKAREILGISTQVMDLFSSRRRAITSKVASLIEAFETKFGRPPNALERDRLSRRATFATRAAKSSVGETNDARLARWDRELRVEVSGGLATVARQVLLLAQKNPKAADWSPRAVLEAALADVAQTKAAWTAPDLTRAISDNLPDHLGLTDPAAVAQLVDQLTEQGLELAVALDAERPGDDLLPPELRLANGKSVYEVPGGRRYATPAQLSNEENLRLAASGESRAPALIQQDVDRVLDGFAEIGLQVGEDQAAAVRGVLTSGAAVESLIGPAGTGKSFVVGLISQAWSDPSLWDGQENRVVGLAASQVATEVLAAEGLQARNITRWLATQERLAEGRPTGDDRSWSLNAGDLVVVDESTMATTPDLAAVHAYAEKAGAKLLLVGDHHQLAAVGPGGAFELVSETGTSYELAEARRFTSPWEAEASLQLRAGDPEVVGTYLKNGRLLDCGELESAEASAARAWLADTLDGRRSLLVVDTNEQAARISSALRAELVRLGRVGEHGVPLGRDGTQAGPGDIVQARRNAWNLRGYRGNERGPINRETYRVDRVMTDGGLVASPILGRDNGMDVLGEPITLPASYVDEDLSLGYAGTVHAAQGATVDTCHVVVTSTTGPAALYVGMSRGRQANTAHVTTLFVPADKADGTARHSVHRMPQSVVSGILDAQRSTALGSDASATAVAAQSVEDARSMRPPAERFAAETEVATAGRTSGWLDRLTAEGVLTEPQRLRVAAEDGASTLGRLLRRAEIAGHDPYSVLRDAVSDRSLDGARQLTTVIHHRIIEAVSLEPQGDSHREWIPTVDRQDWADRLELLATAADARRDALGAEMASEEPQWAIEALGPVPESGTDERVAWERRAGTVAAHRELTEHDDPSVALGPAPKAGQAEVYASWRASWRALGRPEAERDEVEMSDGQLRLRIRAYEREEAWAPDYVAGQLAGTRQAADRHRENATLRSAEAAAATDIADRDRLTAEAERSVALASVLDSRADELTLADQARASWYAHTAATRAASDRARAELDARRAAGLLASEETVTAVDWLAEHSSAELAEDPHREVTREAELVENIRLHGVPDQRAHRDLRDIASGEVAHADDAIHVPSAEQTAATIARAQRALAEIGHRQQADAEAERSEELATWRDQDRMIEAGLDHGMTR